MKLSEANYDNSETGCCARLKRKQWDEQQFVWNDKLFLKDHIRAFLHIPLNFGSVVARDHDAIERTEAYAADPLWLTDELSRGDRTSCSLSIGTYPTPKWSHYLGSSFRRCSKVLTATSASGLQR